MKVIVEKFLRLWHGILISICPIDCLVSIYLIIIVVIYKSSSI